MNTIRIVAAIVDTRQLTLYKEDCSTITIPQGDPRLRKILEQATPQFIANRSMDGSTWADIDLDDGLINSYADFQEQSKGVRFFRVAKAVLNRLFNRDLGEDKTPVRPQHQGSIKLPVPPSPSVPAAPATPVSGTTAPVADDSMAEFEKLFDDANIGKDDQPETFTPVENPVVETKVEQTMRAVDEIMAHAIPVTSEAFNENGIVQQRPMAMEGHTSNDHPNETAEDTIIAVIDDKIVPGVELIKSQFGHAAKMGSTTGVENFLKRLAGVIEHRSHSVEDLLKFMERADLPIAEDGSIIIYKVLRRGGKAYVDCHTKKVEQWVGAYVCMDPSLVDMNRNNECSNGLHVARRGYIRQFDGDVCVLAKLAPEDVITVPSYDANKMRVCGYHILMELPNNLYSLLKNNQPITSTDEGKRILADAVNGKHTRKTHEVRIHGQQGADVKVKAFDVQEFPAPVLKPEAPKEVEAISDDHMTGDTPINPAQVEETMKVSLTKREQAQKLYDNWLGAPSDQKAAPLAELVAFKKESKKSWEVLGITDPDVTGNPNPNYRKEVERDLKDIRKPTTIKVVETVKVLPTASEGSYKDRIAKILSLGLTGKEVAQKIYDIKKASKKGWDTLGVSEAMANQILKLIGKEK